MWTRGDQVVLRHRKGGRLSWVQPVTVVDDSPACVALYLAMGTPLKRPVGADGAPIPRALSYEARAALPWRLGDGTWGETAVLWLARPGAAHAAGVFWRGTDRAFLGWHVDLQALLTRTAVGFDTEDHVLDIVVAPDMSWRWKDEEEFAAAQRIGRFTPAQAAGVRAEGEAMVAAIARRAWPFGETWAAWRPDPAWDLPALPEGWDASP
jgi:hypothetical protein